MLTAYDIAVDPTERPCRTPPADTEPTAGLALVHVPPALPVVDKVVVAATQTLLAPVMDPAVAAAFTVITVVAAAVPQLLVTAYETVVVPGETPVTKPPDPTVAAEVFVLLQTPPPTASESVIEAMPQTVEAPLILPATGSALTVITTDAYTGPQELLTA